MANWKPMLLTAALLVGCATSAPAPRTLETSDAATYRAVEPENLILIRTRHGTTAIELNPDFAPQHSERMRAMARAGLLNGEAFYRVIDGFVAQGGVQEDEKMTGWPVLVNENDRALSDADFTPLGNKDLFAKDVGHMDGFAAARDASLGREWLLHCPGALAMARDEDPDSGATEFYIVLDAQRYLDRNLTVFGRVLDGMEHIQALKRGDRAVESGVIQPPDKGDTIYSVQVAADIPEASRPSYEVMNTNHAAFEDAKTAKRVRSEAFFYRSPPQVLDICGFDVPVRAVE